MTFIIKNKVREYAKEKNLRCSRQIFPVLEEAFTELLDSASERTTKNKRKTIQAHDL